MRISVEPDALRALSRQLQQSEDQIKQIRAVLNQAVGSLVYDGETMEIMMNTWKLANLQGEQMVTALMEMATTLQNKGDQFQTVDEQPVSIFHSPARSNHSPVAMFEMSKENLQLLSGFGKESTVISNPNSAVAAIVGENMKEDTEVGWGFNVNFLRNQAEIATGEGIRGTRYTLNNAAQNPQVWKFIDPKIAAREAVSFRKIGGKLGNADILFDTGVEGYNDYHQDGVTRDTASVNVNGGLGTLAGIAAIGAAVGSVLPIAG
ncbi:MAG TPA: WXG100 family type VII secretion target, partial [Paenibacillus sp.]